MDQPYSHNQTLLVVRGVALCILLGALDQTIIVPALPRMAISLGGARHISWVISAYLLTSTAATPIFGKLSDIHGRRQLLQPALAVFILASLGCAAAQDFYQIVALRAIQGIGGAGLITIAQTAIADVAPPRERGRYQIYMSGMWGIAAIAGPLLGGALTDFASWRAIFWINLPLGALAWVTSRRALRGLARHEAGAVAIDYAGAVLLTGTILVLLLLISGGGWVLAVPGAAMAGLTIWQSRRTPHAVLPPRLFRAPVLLGGLALAALNAICTFGGSLLIPLYFQYIKHTSASESGLLTTPFLLAFVVMSYTGGRISAAMGRTKPAMLCAGGACLIGLLLLAGMGPATPIPLCIFDMVMQGGGIGLVQPNITVVIQNAAERRDVGAATGAMLLFRALGGAIGVTLAATAEQDYGFAAGFGICALAAGVGIIITALMRDSVLRS